MKHTYHHYQVHNNQHKSCELKPLHIATLLIAMAAVSIAYSIVLPVLPFMVERISGNTSSRIISTHTGLLTAIYMLAIAIGAPQWGKLCDRMDNRRIIIIGLAGLAATLIMFSVFENITLVYLGRFLSGLFAAAVPSAIITVISRYKATDEWKARRLSWVGLASIAGSMTGPLFGGLSVRLAEHSIWVTNNKFALAAPFVLAAMIAAGAAVLILTIFPSHYTKERYALIPFDAPLPQQGILLRLLILAFIAAIGISFFHVLLTIRSKQLLGLDSYQIGLMFFECSLVMFVIQAIVFSPLVRPSNTRYLIVPAFVLMTAGLMTVPYSNSFFTMLLSTGSVAASAGLVSPILIYWVSLMAGANKGESLGKQVAAVSFGETFGAILSGLLFGYAIAPFLSFIIMVLLILLVLALSLRMPSSLHKFV